LARPQLLAEVKFLTWTEDNLLHQVVYERLHEDKPAAEVCAARFRVEPIMESGPASAHHRPMGKMPREFGYD
jgi:hypothetical protein